MIGQGKIIKRLLGQPATADHSPESNLSFDSRVERTILRPTSTQTASLSTGSPLTCLDKSPAGNFAVIAGEKIFKTVKIDGAAIFEEVDLRAVLANHAPGHGDTAFAFNDQLNIKAVRWAHGELDTTIITSSANGRITLYDLNRLATGIEFGRIREHARQVHKLAVNPFRAAWLLSASQDGTARLFDIKASGSRNGLIFQSRATFKCNADAVRDIKWSPNDGFEFACSTASGTVQHWDTRKPSAPVLKINAHDSACLSISWHPDGEHLISGGLDQQCKVWDLSRGAEKRQKPKYSFSAPAPVSLVSWRPSCWSSTAQAHRAAQVAVVYDDSNPMKTQNSTVHIWDIARPSLPFKEINDFESNPTGLFWQQLDLLWTVGRSGDFIQTDIAFSPKVIDRRSLSTFDYSPNGEILMILEERQGRRVPSFSAASDLPARNRAASLAHQNLDRAQLSVSRSDSDEDIGGSFLGPKIREQKHRRRQSSRSVNSLSSTPSSFSGAADGGVMKLDEGVKITGLYQTQQVMAIGRAPSATSRETFRYMSTRYLQCLAQDTQETLTGDWSAPPLVDRISNVMEHFAHSAEGVGQFRLAQTWRILSYTMGLLLVRRAQYHRDARLSHVEEQIAVREKQEKQELKDSRRQADQQLLEDVKPRKLAAPKSPVEGLARPAAKSILTDEMESTSNVTTPLARPVRDSGLPSSGPDPTSKAENDIFRLPPAAHSPSPATLNSREKPEDRARSLFTENGYDSYDTASVTTPAIDISVPQRKPPFRLEFNPDTSRSDLIRHDSSESFQMFSTSGDSHRIKLPSSLESGERQSFQNSLHHPNHNVGSSWDSSLRSSNEQHARDVDNSVLPRSDHTRGLHMAFTHPPTIQIQKTSTPANPGGRISRAEARGASQLEDDISAAENFDESSKEITDIDYRFQEADPSFMPPAIDPHILVTRYIDFELQTGCLTAAILVLLLKPHLRPGTIDETQAAAILRQYHHRLQSMMLFTEATLLRKICGPDYPSVFNLGREKQGFGAAYYCTTCQKPLKTTDLAVGARVQKCGRCRTYLDGCVICRQHVAPPLSLSKQTNPSNPDSASPSARIWFWCQGCGHGGHTACMRAWHAGQAMDQSEIFSDGCCPMEGCLHPCLPGHWREEVTSLKRGVESEELGKAVREARGKGAVMSTGVMRDGREAKESRAVESVRGALGGFGERERKKSVKVVAPGEE